MTTTVRGNTASTSTKNVQGPDAPPATASAAPPDNDVEDFPIEAEAGPAVDEFMEMATKEMGGYVSDGNVEKIMAKLATLTPGQQKAAIMGMAGAPLDTLCKECPDALRGQLCALLGNAGLLSEKAMPLPSTHGDGKTKPPDAPNMVKVASGASEAVRQLAIDTNTERAEVYRGEFVKYRGEYQQAVRDTPTAERLRLLGRIQEPVLPPENPAGGPPSKYKQLAETTLDWRTAEMVTNKLYALKGLSAPGVDVGLAVKVTAGYETKANEQGRAQVKANVEVAGAVGSYRDGSSDSSVSVQAQLAAGTGSDNGKQGADKRTTFSGVQVGGGVSHSNNRDGTTTTENVSGSAGFIRDKAAGEVKNSVQGGVAYDETTGFSGSAGGVATPDQTGASLTIGESGVSGHVGVMGTGVSVAVGKGSGSVGVAVVGQSATVSMGPGGTTVATTVGVPGVAQVTSSFSSGSMGPNGHQQGAGVSTAVTGGQAVAAGGVAVAVQGTATVTAQLLSIADVKLMIANNQSDVFDIPAELLRGIPFDQLSPDQKAIYDFYGWTKESWSAEQQRGRDTLLVAAHRTGGR